MAKGAAHTFGLNIRPDQLLQFFHDVDPTAPIPFDAQFFGIEADENGPFSKIGLQYTSLSSPWVMSYEMSPEEFVETLKKHADGLIPSDAIFDGIEVSTNLVAIILLRLKSDHFPSHSDEFPLAHLRYEAGQLQLVNVFEAIKDRRISISDKR